YGGTPPQAPLGQDPYGHAPAGRPPLGQPPAAQQAVAPPVQQQPHTYGYPPPEGAFPDTSVREDSGPVYAQPAGPGPNSRGGDFGTSFNLAPPQPQQPQEPAPAEPVRTNWIAVVSADRDYFTEMMARSGPEAAGLFFPPYCPERRIPLTGRGQLRIGRRSQHRGTVPEIDLSVPPEDPGASHQHAMLAEQADGSWVLVDQDSTNGTTMNGGAEPIAPHTAVPLNDGDRIHIGAWTTITVHRG
ncbi:FHA domain-containing protein, partial [Streptomyces sp. LS1784]